MGECIATRETYGRTLAEIGENEDIVVLDADLTICTMTCYFAEKYPNRFFNIGIAEANMVGVAAGFATTGKIPFCNSFAMFSAGRCYDQVRNSVAYPGLNVKVVGTHAGLSVGEDGATHQCIEDISLMRTIPGMTVLCPCDGNETRQMVKAMAKYHGPCYLRLGRSGVENVTDSVPGYQFEWGKAAKLREGKEATIIATGLMVQVALQAAVLLQQEGIEVGVLDMQTIKPLDGQAVLKAAAETGAIVTTEEHNIMGGLGAAVAELVSESDCRVPVIRHGVNDIFGHSGTAEALMEKYGLTPQVLKAKVKLAIGKKSV